MKKILSAILALLMVLSMFSFAGAETEIEFNEAGTFPVVKNGEGIKLVIGTPEVATVTDYDNNHFTNYLREKMGIEIEIQLFDNSEYKTQLQLMTSSGERLPDLLLNFNLSATERESYGSQGYFIDLLPYFEAHELTRYYDSEAVGYLTETEEATTISAGLSSDGALYAFPFWAVSVADPWSNGLLINNTFCEALGMEIPTTLDEYYDYLVAVKTQDPNGNGLNDEIPLVGFANSGNGDVIINLLNSFTYYPSTWSGAALCCDDDGKIYVPYQTEEFKEGMKFIAKLYAEGLISDLSFSQDRYGLQSLVDLTGEENLDIVGSAMSHRSYMFASHATAERRTHYTSIGPLTGPEGVGYAASSAVEPVYCHFITADCEYPEVAFALLDFLTSSHSTLTARYGREGEYWRYANEEEIARGSSWAGVGYTDVLYTTGNDMKVCWGQQTDEIWNITSITWQPQGFTALTPAPSDDSYDNEITKYNVEDWNNGIMARFGKAPKNLVGSLAYTADEQAMLGTATTDIGEYVRQSMTRMVTGEMDVEADWDEFQNNLKMMGLDTVLECAQAAWDRAH